jgi:hypothetical protein
MEYIPLCCPPLLSKRSGISQIHVIHDVWEPERKGKQQGVLR